MFRRLFILLRSFFLSEEREKESRSDGGALGLVHRRRSSVIGACPSLTFVLVDLVDHPPQGFDVLGQLLQLLHVLLVLQGRRSSWAHHRAGVPWGSEVIRGRLRVGWVSPGVDFLSKLTWSVERPRGRDAVVLGGPCCGGALGGLGGRAWLEAPWGGGGARAGRGGRRVELFSPTGLAAVTTR